MVCTDASISAPPSMTLAFDWCAALKLYVTINGLHEIDGSRVLPLFKRQ
jgi:hypothetical protein